MTITKTHDGDTLTITASGWLDAMTAGQFHDALQDLEGAVNVILSLKGLDYISSAGLRETVALFRRVSAQGGDFSVHCVAPGVMDVFTLTGFDKKFGVYPD